MSLNIGDKIPEFELFNYDKTKLSDKDFLGQKTMSVSYTHLTLPTRLMV